MAAHGKTSRSRSSTSAPALTKASRLISILWSNGFGLALCDNCGRNRSRIPGQCAKCHKCSASAICTPICNVQCLAASVYSICTQTGYECLRWPYECVRACVRAPASHISLARVCCIAVNLKHIRTHRRNRTQR